MNGQINYRLNPGANAIRFEEAKKDIQAGGLRFRETVQPWDGNMHVLTFEPSGAVLVVALESDRLLTHAVLDCSNSPDANAGAPIDAALRCLGLAGMPMDEFLTLIETEEGA